MPVAKHGVAVYTQQPTKPGNSQLKKSTAKGETGGTREGEEALHHFLGGHKILPLVDGIVSYGIWTVSVAGH